MRIGAAFGAVIFGGFVIVACSSSSSDGGSTANVCTPGASVACTGAGGCSGGQVCNASGTSYGDCVCGGGSDSGPSDSGAHDSGPTDAGVDSNVPFTSPKSLAGLTLWVDGDDFGDAATTIPVWPDQSGHGNDLKYYGGASTPPTIHANAIGGHNAANLVLALEQGFDAPTAFSFVTGGDSFVVAVVVNPGSCLASSNCQLVGLAGLGSGSGSISMNVVSGSLNAEFFSATDTGTATITSGPHVVVLRRASATSAEIRVDGVVTAFPLTGADAFSGTQLYNFGRTVSNGQYDGDVAEIVIADHTSLTDVTNLEAYLKSKYGL